MPCRLLPDDRDGIPNVLVEAMAAGAPVVATAVSGIPELVEHERQRAARRARRPARRSPTRSLRLHEDPDARARGSRDNGRETVRERFDGDRLAQRARRRCSGRRLDDHASIAPAPRAAASTSTSTATASWPTRSPPGASRFAGETRDARPRARLAAAPTLPDDEEWRIEWVKFYYGLDLADAYRATGDARYLDAWERLVAAWIRQVPPDHDASRGHRAPDPQLDLRLAAARRRRSTRRRSLESLADAGAPRARDTSRPERNHRTLELYALLIAALALPELDPRPARPRRRPSCTATC